MNELMDIMEDFQKFLNQKLESTLSENDEEKIQKIIRFMPELNDTLTKIVKETEVRFYKIKQSFPFHDSSTETVIMKSPSIRAGRLSNPPPVASNNTQSNDADKPKLKKKSSLIAEQFWAEIQMMESMKDSPGTTGPPISILNPTIPEETTNDQPKGSSSSSSSSSNGGKQSVLSPSSPRGHLRKPRRSSGGGGVDDIKTNGSFSTPILSETNKRWRKSYVPTTSEESETSPSTPRSGGSGSGSSPTPPSRPSSKPPGEKKDISLTSPRRPTTPVPETTDRQTQGTEQQQQQQQPKEKIEVARKNNNNNHHHHHHHHNNTSTNNNNNKESTQNNTTNNKPSGKSNSEALADYLENLSNDDIIDEDSLTYSTNTNTTTSDHSESHLSESSTNSNLNDPYGIDDDDDDLYDDIDLSSLGNSNPYDFLNEILLRVNSDTADDDDGDGGYGGEDNVEELQARLAKLENMFMDDD
eukprot:TRINITY_DN2075_c1_g1_i1.p1 TRINITY_DN2075_c1_g1~~TRINITY_DN2075_c1_g1_i1.p1  ORF type:complete len:470 (-),score=200.39 TRINITY_DN2075_c1_g1_i1:170-1579(-)